MSSDVFISYSRANAAFAHKLAEELKKRSYETWVDVVGIPFTAEWWSEIQRGIESADNFVLVMSPDSLGSPVCHLEIEYARKLNKRIIPVNHVAVKREEAADRIVRRIVDDAYITQLVGDRSPIMLLEANWQMIGGINWFNYPYDAAKTDPTEKEAEERRFYETLPAFIEALNVDMVHVRQHTRLLTRAKDWLNNQQNPALLLVGDDVRVAETWLADWEQDKAEHAAKDQLPKAPQPTDEIREFINASRRAEDERQQQLQALETSRQQSDTAERNARRTLTGVAIMSAVILIAVTLFTSNQVNDAQNQVTTATIAQGQAQFEVITATVQVATAVALQATSESNAETAVALQITAEENARNANNQALTATNAEGQAQFEAITATVQVATAAALQITAEWNAAAAQNAALTATNAQGLAQIEVVTATAQVATAVALQLTAEYDVQIAVNQLATATVQQGIAEQNAFSAQTEVGNANATATQIPPTLTQAAVESMIAGEFANAVLRAGNNPDQIMAEMSTLVAQYPEQPAVYLAHGIACVTREDYDCAIADYTQVIALDPGNAVTYFNRGNIYYEKNDFGNAVADYTRSIAINPGDSVVYLSRGNVYFRQQKYDLAVEDYTRSLAINPQRTSVYYYRGRSYLNLQKYDLAIMDYSQVIQLDPSTPYAYEERAVAYFYAGQPDLALADFEQYEHLGGVISDNFKTIRDEVAAQVQQTATPDK
ncbi:MAG TPA: tetratricopeptide repeat protein [Phototrophicaceae bacterium]|nr:tetratricopeptide repeat protein [Phototrophicaceae bacterium]